MRLARHVRAFAPSYPMLHWAVLSWRCLVAGGTNSSLDVGSPLNFSISFVLRFSLFGCPMTFDDLPLTILLLATAYLISVHLLLRFFSRNAGESRTS